MFSSLRTEPRQPEPGIPTAYRDGHRRAALVDRDLANRYLAATRLGDPRADAVVAELLRPEPAQSQAWIRQGMEGGPAAIRSPAR